MVTNHVKSVYTESSCQQDEFLVYVNTLGIKAIFGSDCGYKQNTVHLLLLPPKNIIN